MGIKLNRKKANVFKVEVVYSQIGDFNNGTGNEDGLVYDNQYSSEYFVENVQPYLEKMLTFTGGTANDKESKKGKRKVLEMNVTDTKFYDGVWDKLQEEGLIEYGVEHLEELNIEHIDGNGIAYDVEISGRKEE